MSLSNDLRKGETFLLNICQLPIYFSRNDNLTHKFNIKFRHQFGWLRSLNMWLMNIVNLFEILSNDSYFTYLKFFALYNYELLVIRYFKKLLYKYFHVYENLKIFGCLVFAPLLSKGVKSLILVLQTMNKRLHCHEPIHKINLPNHKYFLLWGFFSLQSTIYHYHCSIYHNKNPWLWPTWSWI